MASAGYESSEFVAAAVEHREYQSQATTLPEKSAQGRRPLEEPKKQRQTILATMTQGISSDQTRSLPRAPLQDLQALG